jgi:predicted acylesterase/phospholipase RssA
MPDRRLLLVVVALLLVLANSTTAHAQRTGPDTIPLAMSFSGGISLGSYQAGVAWALTHVVRSSRDPSFRSAHRLPYLYYSSLAGASAGNINGVLAAIEGCRRSAVAAENSLFWKSWIPTGIEKLMPSTPYAQEDITGYGDAIFSRRYFDNVLLPKIKHALAATGEYVPSCSVPLGITLTRIDAKPLHVGGQIDAESQRVAALVSFSVSPDGQATFEQVPPYFRGTQLLGETVLLQHGARDTIPTQSVFELVKASSAFPLAFAPVRLRTLSPNGAGSCGRQNDGLCESKGTFSDGGVFDNNPVDLALWLHHIRRLQRARPPVDGMDALVLQKVAVDGDRTLRLVYVNPALTRAPLAPPRSGGRAEEQASARGVTALLGLLGGAVPSARQYELATLARTLQRQPGLIPLDNLTSTTRSAPIIGEHLGAFAGFLGQPFREYDFYVGAYDGLAYAAQFACSASDRIGSGRACVDERLAGLLSATSRSVAPAGAAIMRRLSDIEFQRDTTAVSFVSRSDSLLWAVASAALKTTDWAATAKCDAAGSIQAMSCSGGFRAFLLRLQREPGYLAFDAAILPFMTRAQLQAERTLIGPSFFATVKNPDAELLRIGAAAVRQADRVERHLRDEQESSQVRATSYAEIAFHSITVPAYRAGRHVGPSSIPFNNTGRLANVWRILAPHSLTLDRALESAYFTNIYGVQHSPARAGAWMQGMEIAGSWGYMATSGSSRDIPRPSYAVHTSWHTRTRGAMLPALRIGVGVADAGQESQQLYVPARVDILAGKAHAGLTYYHETKDPSLRRPSLSVTMGFSDLNGLSYWGIRRLAEKLF